MKKTTVGLYTCQWSLGYFGSRKDCVDVDEYSAKLHNGHAYTTCANNDGSFD